MSTLARALEIAREAHAGQTDKAGRPYIEHVLRVVDAVEGTDAKTVAAVHDVIEDHPHLTSKLRNAMPDYLWPDIITLRHCIGQSYSSYIDDIRRRGGIARTVKLADLADNSDPSRLALLPERDRERLSRKYAAALAQLGAEP